MQRVTYAILAAVVACANDPHITPPLDEMPAREVIAQAVTPLYEVDTISGSLGGTVSIGRSINSRGTVAGVSFVTNNAAREAVLWEKGELVRLGTLGGANSSVQWPGQNDNGMVVGISQTAVDDTLGETWSCSAFLAFTGKTCLGFVWENNVMRPLPTLGGDNGFASGVNNRGEVVGWAETRVVDPTCKSPQVLQFRAVLWDTKKGTKLELPPLPGDSTSAATAINNRGQVVGISGECDVAVGRFSALRSVMWEKGEPTELPNLGGQTWHTPMAMNDSGDVVGFSNPPGDVNGSFIVHAFLWTRQSGIIDLGTLPGDSTSQALGINSRREVVGVSTSKANRNRAFLWKEGVMYDLNKIAGAGFADSLVTAQHINEAGKITGRLFQKSTGKAVPYMAAPR